MGEHDPKTSRKHIKPCVSSTRIQQYHLYASRVTIVQTPSPRHYAPSDVIPYTALPLLRILSQDRPNAGSALSFRQEEETAVVSNPDCNLRCKAALPPITTRRIESQDPPNDMYVTATA